MPIEHSIPDFLPWLPQALLHWGGAILAVFGFMLVAGWIWATLYRSGNVRAGTMRIATILRDAVEDVALISPRRVGAVVRLVILESLRNWVLLVFLLFAAILLFAGWFLDPKSSEPARLYLNFVFSTTSYLILLLMLLLTVFSIPNDIRRHTIYTVVTKPLRMSELVVGRFLGFVAVGSVLLVLMGTVSYFFVLQGLQHTHTLTADDLHPVDDTQAMEGYTQETRGHKHRVYIDADGNAVVDAAARHTHDLTVTDDGRYILSGPRNQLVARVPLYGDISFRGRQGTDQKKGLSVGEEWEYRSYIEGGTEGAIIWTFDDMRSRNFPGDVIPVEMNISIFRTHKGRIDRGVMGSLAVRNPETGLTVEMPAFEAKEFQVYETAIPKKFVQNEDGRNFTSARIIQRTGVDPKTGKMYQTPESADLSLAQKTEFDLMEDLVSSDGKVEIWLRCLESGQYFGAAQADLYLRVGDRPFWLNFIKGYAGIWFQMTLIIGFGVMFSTFLSAPIAILATSGVMIGGLFHDFLVEIGMHPKYGGGPVESLIRIVTQANMVSDLADSPGVNLAKALDRGLEWWLLQLSHVIPPLPRFGLGDFVAYGYNIPGNIIAVDITTIAAFSVVLLLVGYFFMRTREVAA